jgi:hypothetical protein
MTKLTLADVNEALNHQITEGSEYQWQCYGPNARFLDYTIGGLDVTAGVIYDTQTQEVYEATLCNGPADLAYRWTNPKFIKAHRKEAKKRGVDADQAWDDVDYIDVSVDEWIQAALDLVSESPVEEEHLDLRKTTDTTVEINLDDSELLQLCMMAHEQDITLNALVNNILREYIDEHGTN